MDDSEEKPSVLPETKPAVTVEFIKNPTTGALVKQERGTDGQFKRQKGTAATPKQRREILRNMLDHQEIGPDGKFRRGDKSIHRRIWENIAKIAMMSPEQPVIDKLGNVVYKEDGKPLMLTDPKMSMASIQAAKEIYLRADGKYSTSDEDLEANKLHGVKIVMVLPPPEMVNREVIEDKPREKLEPKFIEGEIVENKE
jgi:hypothetical protein